MKATLLGAWRSRTVWFNTILALLWGLMESSDAWLPALAAVLPPGAGQWLTLAGIVGNIVLRQLTTQPLAAKGVRDAGA